METALIIIDIQNDYFPNGANPLENSNEAVIQAKKILDLFRHKKLPIIHIQHISRKAGATFFLPDTLGAEIHNTLKPIVGEQIIEKNSPNSFRNTSLLSYLKDNAITNLVICGMMTHMCVDATVRAAKDLDFSCTLIGDACTTKNLEYSGCKIAATEVHISFLAALSYFYANVISADKYIELN